MSLWMALGNPNGSGVVTATLDEQTDNAIIAVSRYSGVDTGNPVGNVMGVNTLGIDGACSGGADTSFYDFNISTSTSDAMIFGAIAHRNRHNDPGNGYTEIDEYEQDGTIGGNAVGMSLQYRSVGSPSNLAFDGTFNKNVDWSIVAFEIRSGDGGSGGGGTTQYNLTTNTAGSGSISLNPAGGTYDEGTIVTVSASPASGFEFSGWSGDLSGSTNPTTITMNSAKSITASFTESSAEQFALFVNTIGDGNVHAQPIRRVPTLPAPL